MKVRPEGPEDKGLRPSAFVAERRVEIALELKQGASSESSTF